MAEGFQIAEAFVDVDADTTGAIRNVNQLIAKVTLLGPLAGMIGSVLVGAIGGTAAAFAAAGIAAAAFGAAAIPQFNDVKDAATLYADAQKAAAEGSADAAEKMKAYETALAQMPPATRATAVAFVGLKNDFNKWSDSLSSTTMPIFTKGIGILRGILPLLTPLVRVAAGALSNFMDSIQRGVQGGGLKRFIAELTNAAAGSLPRFLNSLKNIGAGLVGVLRAFLPFSSQMSSGIEGLTAKFAAWGQGLANSPGFNAFMQNMQTNGPQLMSVLGDIVTIVVKLVQALAPFTGATLILASAFAAVVAEIPTPVLTVLAGVITTLVIGMKIWALTMGIIRTATIAWSVAQMVLNAAFWANPITWVVAGIIALIAVIVLIATKTTWFQTAWNATWNAIKIATAAVWNAIKATFEAIFNAIKFVFTLYFNIYKTIIMTVFNAVRAVINAALTAIRVVFTTYFNIYKTIVTTVFNVIRTIVTTYINTVRTVITTALNAIRSAWTSGWNAAQSIVTGAMGRIRSAVSSGISGAVALVRGLPGRVRGALGNLGGLLFGSGQAIIRGLINGITSMIGNLVSTVSGAVSRVRNLLPFSPAKEGPFSGAGAPEQSGRAISGDLAKGILANASRAQAAMNTVLSGLTPPTPDLAMAGAGAGSGGGLSIENLSLNIKGVFDLSKGIPRDLAVSLREELRKVERDYK